MARLIVRRSMAAAAVLGVAVTLTGCAAGSTPPAPMPTASNTASNPLISPDPVLPMTVELSALPNALMLVPEGVSLVVNTDEPGNWTGVSVDPKVAVFAPGGAEGGVTLNPSFKAVGAGQTKVKLANVVTGDTVDFTISVK